MLLYNLKLNILIFSTSLNSLLIIFIQIYTLNYRNALDRLRVRMNIILLFIAIARNFQTQDTRTAVHEDGISGTMSNILTNKSNSFECMNFNLYLSMR